MRQLSYVAVLVCCLLGTLWLEFALRTRVYRRWIRLVLTLVPVVVVFGSWDLYAISRNHWTFDPAQITGIRPLGELPIDEILFFLVIPVCSILTLEAVRSVRGWPVGDEPPASDLIGLDCLRGDKS